MNRKTKILSVIIIALLAILVLAANIWRSRSMVRDVRVDIDYCGVDTLISEGEVADLIRGAIPDITSKLVRDVDLRAVERVAAASPYLDNCKAGTSIGRSVVLFATQRRPIVRVCAQGDEYYLDDKYCKVPNSQTGSCDVIVASGNIPSKGGGLKAVWNLADYLDKHSDLAPLFDQIYRDGKGDLYLTPKLGNHVVQMGDTTNLDEKFHNLIAFYTRGLPQVGWEKYSQVSVKYKGQVVCTKRSQQQ